MSNLVSIFKMDKKCRKYVEVYRIPEVNEDKVNMLLKNVNIDTPDEEVKSLFKGLCDVRTKSDFKKIRRNRIIINLLGNTVLITWLILLFYNYWRLNN
ncbi:hypothetical protein ACOMCU_25105 [Lysinibacillus sp. UGB7]|uniref:hypothetical protein n=1 Tax=Lysinibacillus sp. UGB7 TaxID=3411039 RepID=UPI003B7A3F56